MSDFLERISKLSPKRLALLALEQHEQLEAAARRAHEPIAVIGMGCRFPGGADDPAAFWQLLRQGGDGIVEVPPDRWDIEALYDPDPDMPARMSIRQCGFVRDIGGFDAAFFGIAPREALSMDPQQRLLLEVVWEALEHAGIAAESLAGSASGVFVGICNSDHLTRMLSRGADRIDAYLASGNSLSVASGRIAYCLGLQGPALSIDTSCSSSLVALHLACGSIRSGESRLAIAAGVNVICSPEPAIALSKAHMLAPDGRCKTFDAQANGFGRGEGCGVVVLKRLETALADGDRIIALIRGSAVNQDGRSGGLTVPNGPAQEQVIRAALADGAVGPGDIDYVEAHGTGTPLGDPIEVRALAAALGAGRSHEAPLMIGSVKTNIGHLESAAGIAGVIKVLLALQHHHLPPHLNYSAPNPHVAWADYPVKVLNEGAQWSPSDRPRLAGVSSFGFSGTNSHVIIEEAPAPAPPAVRSHRPYHCLPISARSPAALLSQAGAYAATFASGDEQSVIDKVHTAGIGRSHMSERAAIIARSGAEFEAALRDLSLGSDNPGLHRGTVEPGQKPEIVFVFTGQGSQYPGMSRRLYDDAPVFRDVIDRCDAILGPDARGVRLKSVLWSGEGDDAAIHETSWTQPALFAVEYALVELWRSWGIEPAAVIGHSLGEYVAACVAGVFTLEEGIRLIAERGRLMQTCSPGGQMAALFTSADEVALAVAPLADRVSIAGVNAPDSVVISGHSETVDQILQQFAARQITGQRLRVSVAAHSPLVDPALDQMEAAAGHVQMRAPRIPVAWNLTGGKALPSGSAPNAAYWRRHLREPVRFADGISELHAQGFRCFLEIGPHPTLTALAQRSLPDERVTFVSSLRRGRDDWCEMLTSLAALYTHGAPVNWAGVNDGYGGRKCTLPTYPFERTRYWLEPGTGQARGVTPATSSDNIFYRLGWESSPIVARAAASLMPVEGFIEALRAQFAQLAARHGLAVYLDLIPELDRLCRDHVCSALIELGFDTTRSRSFDAAAEAIRLGVVPRCSRLFARMLAMLAEDGLLRRRGGSADASYQIMAPISGDDPMARYAGLLRRFDPVNGELRMLRRCASRLAKILTGEQDPLQLLFPDGSFDEARQLYVDSPFARTYNEALAFALQAAAAQIPANRRLRILEVGAGTGGTTGYLLPYLNPERTDYTFTDLSPLFLERAAEQFKQYPFVRYALFDAERDTGSQALERGDYDVIVAANALHATAVLHETLANIRELLAPGGLLLLVEGVARERWADLTFGFTDGWWRFRDTQLRPDYPLLTSKSWSELLQQRGFRDVAVIPGDEPLARGGEQQALIIAQATTQNRKWILVGGPNDLQLAIQAELSTRGEHAILVGAEALDAPLPESGELIYLGAVELASRPSDDHQLASAAQILAGERPLGWLARLARENSGLRTWLVTQDAQSPLDASPANSPWQSPLWGLGRVFALEHPQRWGGLIDLPPRTSPGELARTLLIAIDNGGAEDQIAFRDHIRYVARVQPASPPPKRKAGFLPDATYLIVGGFGGLGLLAARWMVANGARHIALLGRHPDPDLPALRELKAAGAKIIPLASDVTSEHSLRAALDLLTRQAPPLRGVLHAATAASVAPLVDLTTQQVRDMLGPKITGAALLERLTRPLELDFLVLFSSTAAVFGAAGFAHYAAANAFLDAMALSQDRPARRIIAIDWGAWDVIRQASAETKRGFVDAGLEPMPTEQALDALGRLIEDANAQTTVARISWDVFKPLHEARRIRPLLAHMAISSEPASQGTSTAAGPEAKSPQGVPELSARLAVAPDSMRQEILIDFVRAQAVAVLGLQPGDRMTLDAGLFDLGMDSLMSVELRKRLERGTGRKLPSTLTFNYPSINALAGFLLRELVAIAPASGIAKAEPAVVVASAAVLDAGDLDALSESELELRLLQRLKAAQ